MLSVVLLVGAGPAIVADLRARLERYCREGPPSFRNAHGRIRASALPILLWAALHQLDPGAVVPAGFLFGPSDRTRWKKSLAGYEPRAAAWIRRALAKVR